MNAVAKVPGVNAMSIFHDEWVISWNMTGPAVQATILPAVVLTFMGTEAPLQNLIQDTARENDNTSVSTARSEGRSYLAVKGEKTRSFFVANGNSSNELACIVVYQRDTNLGDESLAPWYALNDANFCSIKAETLAQDYVRDGWRVLVR
jgi:hypothetical protein